MGSANLDEIFGHAGFEVNHPFISFLFFIFLFIVGGLLPEKKEEKLSIRR
jgi:hypothetical protein